MRNRRASAPNSSSPRSSRTEKTLFPSCKSPQPRAFLLPALSVCLSHQGVYLPAEVPVDIVQMSRDTPHIDSPARDLKQCRLFKPSATQLSRKISFQATTAKENFMPNISRRSILGTAAALMGTAGLGAAQAKPVRAPAKYDETTDVIVIGSGFAGLPPLTRPPKPAKRSSCSKRCRPSAETPSSTAAK